MLVIRFNRTGKRNLAFFRVVLQESTKAPGKRHVEILGSYNPHKKTSILKKERILYWIGQGAQVSPVVTNLLIREGVMTGKKIAKKMPRPVAKESADVPVVADKEVKTEEVSVVAEIKTEEVISQSETAEEIPASSSGAAPAQEPALSKEVTEAQVVENPVAQETLNV